MRKGQIAYFALLAMVLLISLGFIYTLGATKSDKYKSQIYINEGQFDAIENYVKECIKLSARNSVLTNAFQGGYYNYTNNSLFNPFFILPYYSKVRTKLTPALKQLEYQLSYSLDHRILGCVDNFRAFKEKDLDINFEKPHSKATILENQVLFEVNFPITVRANEKNIKLFDTFSTAIPSRYKLIYTIADEISSSLSKTPDKLCISCLIDYGAKNDLKILVTNYDKKTIRFTIIDEKVRIGSELLIFNFAHQIGDIVA